MMNTPTFSDRLRYLWWQKGIVTTLLMFGFFQLYFYTLNHPAFPIITIPATVIDDIIAFEPMFLWVYLSLWFYTCWPIMTFWYREEILNYATGLLGICTVGLLCFYFIPSKIPTNLINTSDSSAYILLKSLDASGNSCPSLHVATAWFTLLFTQRMLPRMRAPKILMWLNVVLGLSIIYSTMAIKQHVWLDVLAGTILGCAFAYPFRLPEHHSSTTPFRNR